MKIIAYAIGQIYEQYKDKIQWENIVAIADEKFAVRQMVDQFLALPAQDINTVSYDYVAIFSKTYYERIKRDLIGKNNVPEEKVVPWKEVLIESEKEGYNSSQFIAEYLKTHYEHFILDVGMSILSKSVLHTGELETNYDLVVDGVLSESAIQNASLYENVYSDLDAVKDTYDLIFLSNLGDAVSQMEILVEKVSNKLLFHSSYIKDKENVDKILNYFDSVNWKIERMATIEGILWIVSKKKIIENTKVKIYVVTHKKYYVKTDELYQPICVGEYVQDGFLTEKEGGNISFLNKKINECTALYWIWKNTDSEYVGLNHYRRYFYNNAMRNTGNYLNEERIKELLQKYDILLPLTEPMVNMVEIERLRNSMNNTIFEEGYRLVREGIRKHQPDYLETFDDVMQSHNIFVCNMFVTKREILNRYCEWLFSFLVEVANSIDVTGYDEYSQRVIGFFAERMWSVWLRKNRVKIMELPYDYDING